MCLISYHASQEQFGPVDLLRFISLAEKAGFSGIHSSDHFHPWSERQGQSSFTFSWISAAMQICSLPFSMVCAPGQRLHPAIVAQAIATIASMYPGRLIIELGSGEALNECITGDGWPAKNLRNQRLLECYHIISQLLNGYKVNFSGLVRVNNAKLYTLPSIIPPLYCAAISENTSDWAGSWAEGLLTTADHDIELTKSKIELFRNRAKEDLPIHLQFSFCYGRTKKEAEEQAYDQWRSNMIGLDKLESLNDTEQFDKLSATITMEEVCDNILIITDMDELKHHINEIKKLNPASIHLHNISRNQEDYLEDASILF
jgi:probable non-F420 flavinoid oxidoreductase